MTPDPDLIAKICKGASILMGGVAAALKFAMGRSTPAGARRTRKLVSLGWGICTGLATLLVLTMASQIMKNNPADIRTICLISAFLFVVICVGTWVIG